MNPTVDCPGPHTVWFRGSSLARGMLARLGWQVRFDGFPHLQGVAIVYPQTSNWDFVVMLLAKWAIGVSASFRGKDTLFRVPLLGTWMRWLGGIPLDRRSPHGVAGDVPVAMVQLDYSRRQVNVSDFLRLSGDEAADCARMAASCESVRGLHPGLASPVQPLSRSLSVDTV